MGKPAFLESFELIEGGGDAPPSDDWNDGHSAGFAEGLAAAAEDQSALTSGLVQTFADMRFGYKEARNHMIAALGPMFQSLIGAFAPAFAKEMLVPHIAAQLSANAIANVGATVILSVHPGQKDGVAAALAEWTDLPFRLQADPSLAPDQAILTSTLGEVAIDLDGLIAQTQDILSALLDTSEQQGTNHG